MPVGGRIAKSGYSNSYSGNGRSYGNINEELWIAFISMAILIFILIIMALIYILYEKCQKSKKKREYMINA